MPEIHIGSESFAVDSSKGIGEKIFISQDSLTSENVLQILGHELGHLAKYDKDEKTADNVGNKIEEIKAGEEKDYNEYLASIKDKYKDLPSLEESKELENRIPDEYKENFALTTTIIIGGVVLIGSYYSGQKTEEYLNSEEGKRAWSKFEENLKEEWEAKKNKGIAYAEFYQTSLEAFLTDNIGIKDIAIKNETIHKIQVDVGDVILTPGIDKSKFKKGKDKDGNDGYENLEDGSWWEKDRAKHGDKNGWKRWPSKKDKDKNAKKGGTRRTVGGNGKVYND